MKKRKQQQQPEYTYTLLDEMLASPVDPMPADWQKAQLTKMWAGLSSMEQDPEPANQHWRFCSDAVNLMETLIEMGILQDTQGLLMDAVTGLALAGRRNLQGGAIRLDAAGIKAVRAVLEDYREALSVLPARTMIRAHRLTERRIWEIRMGKRRPHDVEIMAL